MLERMIEAMHMELLFVRHRIAVKLANLGQGITVLKVLELIEVVMLCKMARGLKVTYLEYACK